MSADNWALCPRCVHEANLNMLAKRIAVEEGYGKLPLDQFDALREEVAKGVDFEAFRTFREDYEVGTYEPPDGRFYVVYKGACEKCGLSFRYDHEEPFFTPASQAESLATNHGDGA